LIAFGTLAGVRNTGIVAAALHWRLGEIVMFSD